jgi:hypothetical protein
MKTKRIAIETFGWYGSLAVLTAFFLVSFDIVVVQGFTYQALNFSGAVGLGLVAYHKENYSVTFLNIAWILIAIVALSRIYM